MLILKFNLYKGSVKNSTLYSHEKWFTLNISNVFQVIPFMEFNLKNGVIQKWGSLRNSQSVYFLTPRQMGTFWKLPESTSLLQLILN